ncbi:hypothetical protein M8009_03880 [Halomonas sp. ATCH28]|uniref:Sulfotransferase domain-containing protein n=2 Tax=Halomonas gemina TaxID=2945105 RepID=A0ABT0SXR7_9GAMM|nr:hypothetical protein [Halomonas gemina]
MLYYYLKDHPEIFLPELKEPHFYSDDLRLRDRIDDHKSYSRLFDDAPASSIVGEASASYLFSKNAVHSIMAENPDAKIIAMLRNPVEMIQAYHSELCYNLSEDEHNFEYAWSLQAARRQGQNIPPSCVEPNILQYYEVGCLGDQVEKLMSIVPASQRLVILHDDVKQDVEGVYRDVLSFLEVSPVLPNSFEVVNERKRLKNKNLALLHKNLPERLGRLYGPLKKMGNAVGITPSRWMEKYNIEKGKKERLPEHFVHELEDAFRPQVEKLETLLGRDLSHWLRH